MCKFGFTLYINDKECGPCQGVINGISLELSSVARLWPVGNGVRAEAEESPLLEAVTRKRLVKTLQAGKDLACGLVISKVWH
jgi:hypothetical protein